MKNIYLLSTTGKDEEKFATSFTRVKDAYKAFRSALKDERETRITLKKNGWIIEDFTRSAISGKWKNSLDLAILLKRPI